MRVVILSSTIFGYRCLKEGIIATPNVTVVGILTTPPEINISYSEEPVSIKTHVAFDDLARECHCEAVTMKGRMNAAAYMQHLKKWQPDLLLALGWYYIMPRHVRNSAPLGCLGIHASLLPNYRGGAPIPWAIINGEQSTGVTLFVLDEGVDTGDIVAQSVFPITDRDDCATVYEKATEASVSMLRQNLPLFANGTADRWAQSEVGADGGRIAVYPQRKPDDGLIDWSWPTKRIHNFIRAQTRPYPGAFTYLADRKLYIWKAHPEVTSDITIGAPGHIVNSEDGVRVCTKDGTILVTECQFEQDICGPPDMVLRPYVTEHMKASSEQQAKSRDRQSAGIVR